MNNPEQPVELELIELPIEETNASEEVVEHDILQISEEEKNQIDKLAA